MTLENNYKLHSKEYIFSDNKILNDNREYIYSKFLSKKFDKKNNESLKNIFFSDLTTFDYLHDVKNDKPSVFSTDNKNYKINIINGQCKNYKDNKIEIRNIFESDYNKYLDQFEQNNDDIIIDLNKIFLNSGFFIDVQENSEINLEIIHNTNKNQTIFQNSFINIQKNCKIKLDNEFSFANNTLNNIKYNFNVSEQSEIQQKIFQNFDVTSKLYLTSNTICKKNSSFSQNTFNFARGFVRNFHSVKLDDEYAKASLKGCFFLKDDNICTNKTNIIHNSENCESNQTYKGILNNNAKANYYSNTYVSENAQKTQGYQLSKGILLSDNCSFFSKPELRIFADDVKCSHGSTIGPVDESALYYLRSRGINKNQAMKMIISSFINDDLQSLDKNISKRINDNLTQYLDSIE